MWSDDGANGRKRCVCCVLQQLDRFLADNVVTRRKYQSKSPLAPTPPRPHENRQPDARLAVQGAKRDSRARVA